MQLIPFPTSIPAKIHFLAILFTAHAQMLSPPLCTPGNLVSQDSNFLILVVDC